MLQLSLNVTKMTEAQSPSMKAKNSKKEIKKNMTAVELKKIMDLHLERSR